MEPVFIDSKMAALNSPEIGAFHDGRGELYSSDTFNGKAILVRRCGRILRRTRTVLRRRIRTIGRRESWLPAFIAELTREKKVAAAKMVRASANSSDGCDDEAQRAFDFDLGTWKTLLRGCCIR